MPGASNPDPGRGCHDLLDRSRVERPVQRAGPVPVVPSPVRHRDDDRRAAGGRPCAPAHGARRYRAGASNPHGEAGWQAGTGRQAASAMAGPTRVGRRSTVRASSSRAPGPGPARAAARCRRPSGPGLRVPAGGRPGRRACRDRQRGPVLAGAAAAGEPQDAVVDAPDGHAIAAGVRFGLHQDRTVGEDPGVVAFLDRADFRGESVQAVSLNGIKHFFHAPIVGHGCDNSQRIRRSEALPAAAGSGN